MMLMFITSVPKAMPPTCCLKSFLARTSAQGSRQPGKHGQMAPHSSSLPLHQLPKDNRFPGPVQESLEHPGDNSTSAARLVLHQECLNARQLGNCCLTGGHWDVQLEMVPACSGHAVRASLVLNQEAFSLHLGSHHPPCLSPASDPDTARHTGQAQGTVPPCWQSRSSV